MELLEKALPIHQEVSNPKNEAEVLFLMANIKRIVHADYNSAEQLIGKAADLFEKIGDQIHICQCQCQMGHLELAQGRSSRIYLDKVLAMAESASATPESLMGTSVRELETAEKTFQSGGNLFRGGHWDTIADGLRKWLVANNQLKGESQLNEDHSEN